MASNWPSVAPLTAATPKVGMAHNSNRLVSIARNSGTAATVDRSSDVAAGAVVLTIRDAAGTLVLADPVPWSGSVTTATGVSGAWSIQVVFDHASGTVNFRAQKF
jgi:hypothetical protein